MKTPSGPPEIDAEAALVTDPPASRSTPAKLAPAMLPELTTVPALEAMPTPSWAPAIDAEAALVTEPPASRSMPAAVPLVPAMAPELTTVPGPPQPVTRD